MLLLAGCGDKAAWQTPPPASVTVAPVERKEIVEHDDFTGRVEPSDSVEVRPRVSGYIQEVRFQSGQMVRKGDVLFAIDPRWHQAAFDQRQAELEQAKVRLENARREALAAERANAQLTGQRLNVAVQLIKALGGDWDQSTLVSSRSATISER